MSPKLIGVCSYLGDNDSYDVSGSRSTANQLVSDLVEESDAPVRVLVEKLAWSILRIKWMINHDGVLGKSSSSRFHTPEVFWKHAFANLLRLNCIFKAVLKSYWRFSVLLLGSHSENSTKAYSVYSVRRHKPTVTAFKHAWPENSDEWVAKHLVYRYNLMLGARPWIIVQYAM